MKQPLLLSRLLLIVSLGCLSSCDTLGYYRQAITGQLSILARRQSINDVIASKSTDDALRRQLLLAMSIRQFASAELDLAVDKQFSTFVDLKRPFVVWNVFATEEFSTQPARWCYPIAGCVSYKGFFSEASAYKFAESLEQEGLEVYVAGVTAYSTLGWFNDPLLNTVIARREHHLAGLIFHELAHQQLYIPGETEFNESFATTVESAGVALWLERSDRSDSEREKIMLEMAEERRRDAEFVHLVQITLADLEKLYQGRSTESEMREKKAQIISGMRVDYARLKAGWDNYNGYDRWFAGELNNAQLATVATYNELVPAFTALLDSCEQKFACFYKKSAELAALDSRQRAQSLLELKQ